MIDVVAIAVHRMSYPGTPLYTSGEMPSAVLGHVLSALGGAAAGAVCLSVLRLRSPSAALGSEPEVEADLVKSLLPPSAFFLYCEDNAARARRENPGHHQIQGLLNKEWEEMSAADRAPFLTRYEQLQLAELQGADTAARPKLQAFVGADRFELPEPGPMLPPVPAVILGVAGDETRPPDLTIVWSFVIDGPNAQIGIS